MAKRADIIIVGAGIQGASLAFELSKRGADVLVLEMGSIASGGTGKSCGLVRMHYDLESDAQLAWTSFPYFERWDDMVGAGDGGFVRRGFLQLVPPPLSDALRANVQMMQGVGIEVAVVSPSDVAELFPGCQTDDIEVAAYEPRSGYADLSGSTAGFLAAARERGARLEQGRRVEAVIVRGDRVAGVETDGGAYQAPIVVNAAGPWAAGLAASVGLDLPSRSGAMTRPTSGFRRIVAWTGPWSSTMRARSTSGPRGRTRCWSVWGSPTRSVVRPTGPTAP
jgi:sarcosine oxidase subunit beta